MDHKPHHPLRHHRAACAALLLATHLLGVAVAVAQGPPEYIRSNVDAFIQTMRAADAEAIETLLDTNVSPDADQPRDEMRQLLARWQSEAKTKLDDISVEHADRGVDVLLGHHGNMLRVNLVIEPEGIVQMNPVGDDAEITQTIRRDSLEQAVVATSSALETSPFQPLEEFLRDFERDHLAAEYLARSTPAQRRDLMVQVRDAAEAAGGVMLNPTGDGYELVLDGRKRFSVTFTLQDQPPFKVTDLAIEDQGARPQFDLDVATLPETLESMAGETVSGAIFARIDGQDIVHQGYGLANAKLGAPNTPDTVFGIGSTPIDFTVAGIYLLTQQGHITLDDRIDTHFDGVPDDKRQMTIRHLMTGQSGLPDFHDVDSDWDADLAWIDRDEAVRRILAQPLLFAPGSNRKHSHSAFGLLAALIEIVGGEDYYGFLQQNFFEPAGMTRTAMYGDRMDLTLQDFAVGGGPSYVGLPNISPNWGPTSWLVLGSGGMVSTLNDILRFFAFVTSDQLLEERFAQEFDGPVFSINGSERGFYLFHARRGKDNEVVMMLNRDGRNAEVDALARALGDLVEPR